MESPDFSRITTVLLPALYRAASSSRTSWGLATGFLPPTSRMTSPVCMPCSAAGPFGSTAVMARPRLPRRIPRWLERARSRRSSSLPSTAIMTSPAFRPALAAGLPAWGYRRWRLRPSSFRGIRQCPSSLLGLERPSSPGQHSPYQCRSKPPSTTGSLIAMPSQSPHMDKTADTIIAILEAVKTGKTRSDHDGSS